MLFVNNCRKGIQRNKKRNLYRKVHLMQLNYLFNTNDDSGIETETNKRHIKVGSKVVDIVQPWENIL